MNGMLDRREASDRAQRRLVADASHELCSPLAALTTTAEVADADASGTMWPDVAPALRSQAHRMGRLVEDLLTLATADDAGLRLRTADTDLDEVVREELARMRPATRYELRVRVDPVRIRGGREPAAAGGPEPAVQRRAPRGLCIAVTSRAEGTDAVLTADDDGAGTVPQDRERVFERFVPLEDCRARDTGGSGPGLAITRETVAAHRESVRAVEGPEDRCRSLVRLLVTG